VKHGVNGWVVKTGDVSAIASLLFDIHQGKTQVHRDLSQDRKLDGEADPNAVAERFVGDFEQPVPKIHAKEGDTSEDFWTVGNACRWMVLVSRILGLKAKEGDEVLGKMEAGRALVKKGEDGGNVWKLVMGDDMLEGEGEVK
jgi:hypothetical protein